MSASRFADRLRDLQVRSSADGSDQPARVFEASGGSSGGRPLLVVLHTWGGTWQQDLDGYLEQAGLRDWHAIQPHFRGPNRHPDACGSPKAQQDILDAVDWALVNLPVDGDRIYLAGGSGGGHMTLLMMACHAARFAAASAWCPIADLVAWHAEHVKDGASDHYASDIEASAGGAPGASAEVDRQLRTRSPLFHMAGARGAALDINHGITDGKTGSVPFRHSIDAFNAVARANGDAEVTQTEIDQLWEQGKLAQPQAADEAPDPAFGERQIFLRRHSGRARLTIFAGGHEALPCAACAWLSPHTFSGKLVKETAPAHPPAPAAAIGK